MSTAPYNKPPVKVPLQVAFIVPFVLLLALAVGLVGYLSFRNGQHAVNEVAHQLREELTAHIEKHLDTFLDTPHQINQVNANAMRQGWLKANDTTTLERHFWEQIQIFDSVTSIYFGNTAGGLVNAGREGPVGSLYVIVTDGFVSGPFRKYGTDSQGNQTEILATVPDFDARTRPWYTGAVKKGDATWSDVYILFTGQDMAIAASRPVYDAQGNLLGVVSIDLFLSHLSSFLQSLEIGETGQAFIMERSGLLVASSTAEKPFTQAEGDEAQRRLYAGESANPLIHYAAEALAGQLGDNQPITEVQHLEFEIDGQRQFLEVSPVKNEYGLDWLIVVVIPEADFMGQINVNNRTTTFLVITILAMAIITGIMTARGISRPIKKLNISAQALAQGKWTQPVNDDGWLSEISELTQSFNRMAGQLQQMLESLTTEIAERKQAQEKMMQQERLAAVGQLAAGIAHDFNNILTSILGYAELLHTSPDTPEPVRADLERIIVPSQRAAHLVRQILDFSRKSIRQPKQLDLGPFIEEALKFLERTIPETIHLSLEIEPGDYLIEADPTQMHQMLTNLVLNARDAMPAGGELRVTLSRFEVKGGVRCLVCNKTLEGDWIGLMVADTGSGIPPEVLSHIFEPFFTTKGVGQGSGLGLSQVLGIIQQHGGHVGVTSRVGQGTIFTSYLPPLRRKQNNLERGETTPMRPGHNETILLVEDEPIVLAVNKAMLQRLGYQVLTATNGQEALAVYTEHQDTIALVLSDIVMPDMGGLALFEALKVQNPGIKVVLMSGYPLGEKGAELLAQGVVDWFQKPISFRDLSQIIGKALVR